MQKQSGKDRFKNYLRKIGSGQATGRSLTRKESADALKLLLNNVPTPAQTGAFMIAHRIKRPEVNELAGMIDTYKELGPKLQSGEKQRKPIFFGMPFDGRLRTSPIYPLTTLVLLAGGQPVILQGGTKMPIKYGITTKDLFHALGLDLKNLTMLEVQNGFVQNNFAFIYQPNHFSLADNLISFREEIGKRTTIASLELIWCAHEGEHIHISGYVHSPTKERHLSTLQIIGETNIVMIKGLEGGIDLPVSHQSVASHFQDKKSQTTRLNPQQYNLTSKDIPWKDIQQWQNLALKALNNDGPLIDSLMWNSGVYFALAGVTNDIEEGIDKAKFLISSKSVLKTLEKLIKWRSNI